MWSAVTGAVANIYPAAQRRRGWRVPGLKSLWVGLSFFLLHWWRLLLLTCLNVAKKTHSLGPSYLLAQATTGAPAPPSNLWLLSRPMSGPRLVSARGVRVCVAHTNQVKLRAENQRAHTSAPRAAANVRHEPDDVRRRRRRRLTRLAAPNWAVDSSE